MALRCGSWFFVGIDLNPPGVKKLHTISASKHVVPDQKHRGARGWAGYLLRIQDANLQCQGSERILDFFGGKAIVGVPGFAVTLKERLYVEGWRGWNKRDFAGVVSGNFRGWV